MHTSGGKNGPMLWADKTWYCKINNIDDTTKSCYLTQTHPLPGLCTCMHQHVYITAHNACHYATFPMMLINDKNVPTNDTNCSCRITCLTNHMGSVTCINCLDSIILSRLIHTHMHIHFLNKSNFKRHMLAAGRHTSGLKVLVCF